MEFYFRRWIFAGLVLLACITCIGTASAAPVTVFSDNFNDNVLDTALWTADVAGTNCAFAEQNNRAEFQTYGGGSAGWHAYLNSKPILIDGWDSIEITGTYANTGYTSRSHIATVTDLDRPVNTLSVELAAWGAGGPSLPQMYYYWNGGSSTSNAPGPSPNPRVVPFRLKITRTGFEYYENGALIKQVATPTLANTRRFQLQVGAWEFSPILSKTYIDEIQVRYTPESVPPVTAASVAGSPGPAGWYTAPVTVTLTARDPAPGSGLDRTLYSTDGTTWTPYSLPVVISTDGSTSFRYYSVDRAGNAEPANLLLLKIDRTPPVTTAAYAGTAGTNGWYTGPVTVTLSSSDSATGSGVVATNYRVGTGPVLAYTGPFVITDPGETAVSYFSRDLAGNTGPEASDRVLIDALPPDVIITSPEPGEYLQSETVTLGYTVSDAGAGPAGVQATLDGGAADNGQVIDLSTLATGEHAFAVTAADEAGNSATAFRAFTVKPLPASVSIEPSTLNLKSQADRNAVTVFIELPGADVNAIDIATVTLSYAGSTLPAQATPTTVGDANGNGIPDRMVKFSRQALTGILAPGEDVVLTIRGRVAGDMFEGTGTIRVIGGGAGNKS
jgi:hypothetical protein